jgi:Fic family protein
MEDQFQPLVPDRFLPEIEDKAVELIRKASVLDAKYAPKTAQSLGAIVRIMNCYYSNLIEGHKTSLIDLEIAREEKDNVKVLSLSKAHLHAQEVLSHCKDTPFSKSFIELAHSSFYSQLPESLHYMIDAQGNSVFIPQGEFRDRPVQVGGHVPIDNLETLNRYFYTWSKAYSHLSTIQKIYCLGASHHRLLWIHPFLDGNGRVARLFSDSLMRNLNLTSSGIWCLSRGLARKKTEYFQALTGADQIKMGDLDGRGRLSQKRLQECCSFFLDVALDQVDFMITLFDLDKLRSRYKLLLSELNIPLDNVEMIIRIFERGEMQRGEFSNTYPQKSDRYARSQLRKLLDHELIASDSERGDLYIHFPVKHLEILMPRLFLGEM